MSIFRPPASPQAITVGLALFLTGASGPAAPLGSSAAAQVQVAYREPLQTVAAQLATQHGSAVFAASGGGGAANFLPPAQLALIEAVPTCLVAHQRQINVAPNAAVFVPPAAPALLQSVPRWPYVPAMLPAQVASAWGIADNDLIFDRLQPTLPQQAPAWPYPATMVAKASASIFGAAATAYLRALVPSVLPAQSSWPYASTQPAEPLPIIAAAVQVAFAPTSPLPSVAWPYLLSMQGQTASQWSIPPAALVFDRLQPTIIPAAPWPYLTTQLVDAAPITVAAQVPSGAEPQLPSVQAWPYVASMLDTPSASQWSISPAALVFDRLMPTIVPSVPWGYAAAITGGSDVVQAPTLGPQIPPSPVLQWLAQPLYPYAATFSPAPTLAGLLAPVPYWTWVLPINPVRAAEWPHASVRLPAPSSSMWAQAQAFVAPSATAQISRQPWPYGLTQPAQALQIAQAQDQVPPGVAAQFVSQPWPYLLAAPAAGLAATVPAPAQMLAPQSVQPIVAQAWPYVIKTRDFANVIALIGPQAPPQPVLQWVTQPPWSYSVVATLYPGPATLLAPPFVVGNTEVWHVEPRPRDWAVEPRPRFWAVQDH